MQMASINLSESMTKYHLLKEVKPVRADNVLHCVWKQLKSLNPLCVATIRCPVCLDPPFV